MKAYLRLLLASLRIIWPPLLAALVAAACTTIPQRQLQTYRQAFDEARAQSLQVLADHAAARQARSNLLVELNLRTAAPAEARPLSSRLGLASLEALGRPVADDMAVRLRAWEVIGAYNEALTAVAAGVKGAEIESSVNGFLATLQKFPLKEVAKMAGEVVPYAAVISELITVVQREVEARRFRQAVLHAEEPMAQFVGLLRSDATLFHQYRVGLLNERFVEQEIALFDRADRFRIVTAAHGWNPAAEVKALAKQVNSSRVVAAGIESFPAIAAPAEAAAPTGEAELGELRMLAETIERESQEARATVNELNAYHELMRQYVLLVGELDHQLRELSAAAHKSTGQLPSIEQLQQIISNVRLAHLLYRESK